MRTELLALIPVAVPLVIAGIKLLLPRVPKVWLPVLAPVLGAIAEVVVNYSTQGHTDAPWLGSALGAAGVGLREIADQVRKLMARAE